MQQRPGPPQRRPDLQRRPHGRAGDAQLLPAAARDAAAGAAALGREHPRSARRRAPERARRVAPGRRRALAHRMGAPVVAARRPFGAALLGRPLGRDQQPDPDRRRLRPDRRRLAEPPRGLLLVPRLALPGLGRDVAGLVVPGNAVEQRRQRVHAVLVLGGSARPGGPVLPQLRRAALAHHRERRRAAMGRPAVVAGAGRPGAPVLHGALLVLPAGAGADRRDGDLPGRDAAPAAAGFRADGAHHRRRRAGPGGRARRAKRPDGDAAVLGPHHRPAPAVRGRRDAPVPDVRPGVARDRGRPQPPRRAS